jgi:hypothetical protein
MRRGLLIVLAGVVVLPACPGNIDPVETNEQEAGIHIEVVGCDLDRGTGNVTLTYEVRSEKEYDVVLVEGRVKDGFGTVVGSSTGTVTNVVPGENYRDEMVLSSAGEPQGELTCEATLDLATEPLG